VHGMGMRSDGTGWGEVGKGNGQSVQLDGQDKGRTGQGRAIDELLGPCRGRYLRVTNVKKCELYLFST